MFRTAASVLVASTLALQVVYPPAFPRPNATRLLETDRLVIWDIVWPEGQPTSMHRHLNDQVGTYYQAGGRRITTIDGAERETMSEVGSLSDTRKGTTHIEEGITDSPLRAVFIEMKQEGPSSPAEGNSPEPPTFFPRIAQTSMLDDARVTVWEYGQTKSSSPLKGTTTRDTVIVWLGTGKLTTTASAPDTASTTVPIQPGKMEYLPKGTTTTRQVTEGDPRAIVFEFK